MFGDTQIKDNGKLSTSSNIMFIPLGGANETSAASYLLIFDDINILIDTGVRFGSEYRYPDFGLLERFLGSWQSVSAVLITHAHMDHYGAIMPALQNLNAEKIYMTFVTHKILSQILTYQLQFESEAIDDEILKAEINSYKSNLFTKKISHISFISEFKPIYFESNSTGNKLEVIPIPSGHMLGAVGFIFNYNKKRIFFTSDYQPSQQYSVGYRSFIPEEHVDVIILDGTNFYKKPNSQELSRPEQEQLILKKVSEALSRDEVVVFPVQATGHALEIIKIIDNAILANYIKKVEIVADGYVSVMLDLYNELYNKQNISLYSSNVIKRAKNEPIENILLSSAKKIIVTTSKNFMQIGSYAYKYTNIIKEYDIPHLIMSLIDYPQGQNQNSDLKLSDLNVFAYRLDTHINASDAVNLILRTKPEKVVIVHANVKRTISKKIRDVHPLMFRRETSIFQSINTQKINL